MSENEIKLIEMIRNHSNPGEAFVIALEIILSVIKPHNQPFVDRTTIDSH